VLSAMLNNIMRMHTRVMDLFKQWDEDRSSTIDAGEFRRAMKSFPSFEQCVHRAQRLTPSRTVRLACRAVSPHRMIHDADTSLTSL
jgi:Ca2+-binding EF-hand superfamily protein